MSNTLYTQHTVRSIFVGPTGHQHTRSAADDGETPFAVSCAACEPHLVKEGWVYRPELVPLTDDQLAEQERLEREGNLVVRQAAEKIASRASDLVSAKAASPARRGPAPRSAKTT